jgi:hypothetical protein
MKQLARCARQVRNPVHHLRGWRRSGLKWLWVTVVGMSPAILCAAQDAGPEVSPVNPDYIAWQEALAAGDFSG